MMRLYNVTDDKLFVHYPHITRTFLIETGFDGEKFAVFEEVEDLDEFVKECEGLGMHVDTHCFGGDWSDNAVAISDLI